MSHASTTLAVVGVEWVKWKIAEEWAESLPDRRDSAKAAKDVDTVGIIRDYENSYDMHHRVAEATPQEIKVLLERQKRADQGLIVWDEAAQKLLEVPNRKTQEHG